MKDKANYRSRTLLNEGYQQDQVTFATYHCVYFTVWSAANHLTTTKDKCPKLQKHLESLIIVYGLTELARDSTSLYECGYFKPGMQQVI